VVLLAVAGLLGLVVLLLAVPIDVAFGFERVESFTGRITVLWLFGLVRFRIPIPGAAKPPRPEAEPQIPPERAKPRARGRRANVLAVLRQAAFRRRVYRFAKDLVRAAHARELYLRIRLGLGDPADTGRLWAFVGPLNALAQNLRNAEVRVEPEFVDPVFKFETHGRFLLVPLQFAALAIAFALSPPSLRAWYTLRRSNA
jgi:Protein of unknown function (DUF2953)